MSFIDHLHFFLSVVVFTEYIYLRNYIKCDWIVFRKRCAGKNLRGIFLPLAIGFTFIQQFINAILTRPGYGLIGGNDNPLNSGNIVNRFQSHKHDDSRAVWVGYNPVMPCYVFRIDFRYYQRNQRIHTE